MFWPTASVCQCLSCLFVKALQSARCGRLKFDTSYEFKPRVGTISMLVPQCWCHPALPDHPVHTAHTLTQPRVRLCVLSAGIVVGALQEVHDLIESPLSSRVAPAAFACQAGHPLHTGHILSQFFSYNYVCVRAVCRYCCGYTAGGPRPDGVPPVQQSGTSSLWACPSGSRTAQHIHRNHCRTGKQLVGPTRTHVKLHTCNGQSCMPTVTPHIGVERGSSISKLISCP